MTKKLKRYFVTDDSLSGRKLKAFVDAYRTALDIWRSEIPEETVWTILGDLGVNSK